MTSFKTLNIIGLTGMSGSGKSTAAAVFAERGYTTINCDRVAKAVITRPPCSSSVLAAFPEAFDDSSSFDKTRMSHLVFAAPDKLKRYENIVFPYILYEIIKFILNCGQQDILLDAPTLYQSGADDLCNKVIAVVSDAKLCISRITARDRLAPSDAELRLSAQPCMQFYADRADILINNNNTKENFIKSLMEIKLR